MAELKTKTRMRLPDSAFADKRHAANAKARATQRQKKGNLSKSQASMIKAKANKVLAKKK